MMQFEISLPETVAGVLGLTEAEGGQTLRKELAAYFFERQILTFGQARQWAETSVWDFIDLLRERKIPYHYDVHELEEDLQTIKALT